MAYRFIFAAGFGLAMAFCACEKREGKESGSIKEKGAELGKHDDAEPSQPAGMLKCDGKEYSPETHTCINGLDLAENGSWVSFSGTDDEEYEPIGECDGETVDYDKETQGCCNTNNGGLYLYSYGAAFCGPERYAETSRLYKRCAGREYNPRAQFCKDKKIYSFKCGGKNFALSGYDDSLNEFGKFCADDKIYDACSEGIYFALYNPKTHACENGKIKAISARP